MNNRIEEYKLLVDIYYKEINILYAKITVFITIQLAFLAGFIVEYDKLLQNKWTLILGLIFLIFLSFCQTLVSIRGNVVNNALIATISDFEEETEFKLLSDFSANVDKINKIKRMNFPSIIFTYISVAFVVLWSIFLLALLGENFNFYVLASNATAIANKHKHIFFVIISACYAVTMKISDLLDEHNLKLFKGADILFSILCAVFACILITFDVVVANIIMAMVMGFVIRRLVDYRNHVVAFTIITTYFLLKSQIMIGIYVYFLISTIIFGLIKDIKYRSKKSKIVKAITIVYLSIPIIYAIPSFLYSIYTSDWLIFFTFFTYDLFYNITRLVGEKNVQHYYSDE